MHRYRKDFFLATKTAARSYSGAKEEIFRSLDRLKTDYIDLIQMHSLTHPDEWEQAFASEGALEALKEVRNEGLVKFIGVTGHGWTAPAMHKKSIERFDFDSILTDCFDGTRLKLSDYIYKMIDTVHLSLSELGNSDVLDTLDDIIKSGTEADHQIDYENKYGKNKLLLYLMNDVEYNV